MATRVSYGRAAIPPGDECSKLGRIIPDFGERYSRYYLPPLIVVEPPRSRNLVGDSDRNGEPTILEVEAEQHLPQDLPQTKCL